MTASDALTGEPARLLDASAVEVDHAAGALHVLCPAGTTFDAAEALRLQIVDRAPPGVVVDVEIVPSEPGTLSPEDEAGARLFGELRRERLVPPLCEFCGRMTCGCVVVSDGARYVPGREPGDRERLLEHVAAIEAKLGSAVNAFPWDEPEGAR